MPRANLHDHHDFDNGGPIRAVPPHDHTTVSSGGLLPPPVDPGDPPSVCCTPAPPFVPVCTDVGTETVTLHVVDGVATDSTPVTAGQWVYVVEIVNAVTWAGSSPADFAFNSVIDFFGTRIVSWVSPWPSVSNPGTWTSPDVSPPDGTWSYTDQASEGDWIDASWVSSGVYRGAHPVISTGSLSAGITVASTPFAGYNGTVKVAVSDIHPSAFVYQPLTSVCSTPGVRQSIAPEQYTFTGLEDSIQTNYDYRAGSLHFYLSGVRVILTETDPTTGLATLPAGIGFPEAGEIGTWHYITEFGMATGVTNDPAEPSEFVLRPATAVVAETTFDLDPDVGSSLTGWARDDHTHGSPPTSAIDDEIAAIRWEPHVSYDGTVVLDSHLDPVMQLVTSY